MIMEKTAHLPPGYHTLTPSMSFRDTERAISWYKTVFGAEEKMKVNGPDKKIMHAEIRIGDSLIFLAEENPQYDSITPQTTKGNSVKLHMYVEDVDGVVKKAVQNGAKLVMAPMDMFYGDRVGNIEDPFGYSWVLSTHVKDVSEEEMREKAEHFEPA
jgi:PhnB protein